MTPTVNVQALRNGTRRRDQRTRAERWDAVRKQLQGNVPRLMTPVS